MFEKKKKTVYLMVVEDLSTKEVEVGSYEYDSVEECKADFKMFTSDVENPIGYIVKKISEEFKRIDK